MKQLPIILSIVALAVSGFAIYRQGAVLLNPDQQLYLKKETSSKPADAGSFRIAYFEMDSIESNYHYVKDSYKQVKSKEEAISNELMSIEKGYQRKIEEWKKKGAQMSQSESEQVQREYAQMQQSFQNKKMALDQELNEMRNKKLRDIQIKIEDYLKEFNKSRNYSFVFSYEPALFIYYKDSAFNITPELLAGLNEEYTKTKESKNKNQKMAVDFDALFSGFTGLKIMVVGDVMLDTYLWGNVDRISPEAPVPVIALKKDHRLGGAANVALNIRSLGAEVAMFSVIGNDEDAGILRMRFSEEKMSDEWIISSNERITTNKTRVISRNQQMLRMDAEIVNDLSLADETALILSIETYIREHKPQVLIFEDYNKGVLTERVITALIEICQRNKVITTVDPKRKNFFAYKGVTIFKPNLKEITEAFNLLNMEVNLASLKEIHELLYNKLDHNISFITLSEKGVFFNDKSVPRIIPSHIRNIADVSGAGDTVIAVASLAYAATGDVQLMAEIANLAGGLVCEEVGTAAINKERLLEECKLLLVK